MRGKPAQGQSCLGLGCRQQRLPRGWSAATPPARPPRAERRRRRGHLQASTAPSRAKSSCSPMRCKGKPYECHRQGSPGQQLPPASRRKKGGSKKTLVKKCSAAPVSSHPPPLPRHQGWRARSPANHHSYQRPPADQHARAHQASQLSPTSKDVRYTRSQPLLRPFQEVRSVGESRDRPQQAAQGPATLAPQAKESRANG